MDPLETAIILVAYALASAAVVDVWLRGSLFADARSRIEAEWSESGWLWSALGELLGCGHCLSYNVPIWLLCWIEVPAQMMPPEAASLWRSPIIALAVGRLAWMLTRRD